MKQPKKKSSKTGFIVAALGIPILAVVIFFLTAPLRREQRAQHDVDVLLLALNGFVREQGDLPIGDTATICRLLRGESVDGQNPKRLDYVEAEAYEVNAKGEFVDPWGVAYRIVLDRNARVYSCGPNKVDDQGKADDIVAR
ncbi:MAG: hypothetical protein WCS70_02915 [Verrucomicrobiota bacterium]